MPTRTAQRPRPLAVKRFRFGYAASRCRPALPPRARAAVGVGLFVVAMLGGSATVTLAVRVPSLTYAARAGPGRPARWA